MHMLFLSSYPPSPSPRPPSPPCPPSRAYALPSPNSFPRVNTLRRPNSLSRAYVLPHAPSPSLVFIHLHRAFTLSHPRVYDLPRPMNSLAHKPSPTIMSSLLFIRPYSPPSSVYHVSTSHVCPPSTSRICPLFLHVLHRHHHALPRHHVLYHTPMSSLVLTPSLTHMYVLPLPHNIPHMYSLSHILPRPHDTVIWL